MNPIEEAKAYQKYTKEYGRGSISELARIIGKSQEYVSKRLKLLDLPEEVQVQIIRRRIKPSLAEELTYVKNKEDQSKLAELLSKRHLTVKGLRDEIKKENSFEVEKQFRKYSSGERADQDAIAALNKSIVSLKIALHRLGEVAESINGNWVLGDVLLHHQHLLHSQIDLLIRSRKAYPRVSKMINVQTK